MIIYQNFQRRCGNLNSYKNTIRTSLRIALLNLPLFTKIIKGDVAISLVAKTPPGRHGVQPSP